MSEGGDRPAGTERPSELPHSIEDALASLEQLVPSEQPPVTETVSFDGVILADTNGTIQFASQRWATMHGYDPAEITGLNASAFFDVDQRQLGLQGIDETLQDQGTHRGDVAHVRKDGTTFRAWTETTLLFEGDEPMGRIIVAREHTTEERRCPSDVPAASELPLGFAVVSVPDDRFLQVDAKVSDLTGYTREELHQLTLTDITYNRDLEVDEEEESPSLFIAGELPLYTSERRLVRKDGGLRWVRIHKSVLVGLQPGMHLGLCVLEDLRVARHSFDPPPTTQPHSADFEVLMAFPDGFALFEVIENDRKEAVDCRILDINPAFEKVTHLDASRVIGQTILEVLPNKEAAWMLEICSSVVGSGRASKFRSVAQREGRSFDFVAFTPKDGQVALIVQDVTDLRRTLRLFEQSQEELRGLYHRVNQQGERERSSVSALLNDNIIRRLDALRAQLSLIRAYADKGNREPLETQLEDGRSQLTEVTQSIRALASRLRPPRLDEEGLFAALKIYCQRYAKSTSLSVVVDGDDLSPRLTSEQEIALFRIVEEALSNVAAHAQASKARVHIEDRGERVGLVVEDDGIGIDLGRRSGRGLGIVAMREAALAARGTIRFEPAQNRGTQIVVEVLRESPPDEGQ